MNAFFRKLECYAPLNDSDTALIKALTEKTRSVPRKAVLVREGEPTDVVHIVLDGFAIRHKDVGTGKRQIFGYLVPGDICDLHVALLEKMDHTVSTLCDCVVGEIRRPTVLEIVAERPAIIRALWWTMLVDEAVLRDWITNIGARHAELRIAHLFCEIHARLNAIGRVSDGVFRLPITQQELADTLGLSLVHANLSLKVLRERGLAWFHDQTIEIPDVSLMRKFADFDESYLHLHPSHRALPSNA